MVPASCPPSGPAWGSVPRCSPAASLTSPAGRAEAAHVPALTAQRLKPEPGASRAPGGMGLGQTMEHAPSTRSGIACSSSFLPSRTEVSSSAPPQDFQVPVSAQHPSAGTPSALQTRWPYGSPWVPTGGPQRSARKGQTQTVLEHAYRTCTGSPTPLPCALQGTTGGGSPSLGATRAACTLCVRLQACSEQRCIPHSAPPRRAGSRAETSDQGCTDPAARPGLRRRCGALLLRLSSARQRRGGGAAQLGTPCRTEALPAPTKALSLLMLRTHFCRRQPCRYAAQGATSQGACGRGCSSRQGQEPRELLAARLGPGLCFRGSACPRPSATALSGSAVGGRCQEVPNCRFPRQRSGDGAVSWVMDKL